MKQKLKEPATPARGVVPRTIDMETRLDALEQQCNRLLDEFAELSGAWRDTRDRMMLGSVLARTRSALARLGLELGA